MKEAYGGASLSDFRTPIMADRRFNDLQFLVYEVIISGFWHALSLSRLLKYIRLIT